LKGVVSVLDVIVVRLKIDARLSLLYMSCYARALGIKLSLNYSLHMLCCGIGGPPVAP